MVINTYIDRKYLPYWLCLYESLREHCPSHTKYVWALSDEAEIVLRKMRLPGVIVKNLAEIEDDALRKARGNRQWIEYVWTLPASLLLWMLQNLDVDAILHIDADCLLYGSLDPILEEIGDASTAITPHRFSPQNKGQIPAGRFNAGVIYVRNDTLGVACMQEWRDSCIEWCYWGPDEENKRATNQRYLNYWPQKYGAYSIQHKGFQLAPWNQAQYAYTKWGDGPILVDGIPLVLYHFHGTRIIDEKQRQVKDSGYKNISDFIKLHVEHPYIRRLQAAIEEIESYE